MRPPWLSVITPAYNGSRYIARALKSIAEQGDPDIEVIVVDDGSTDDTVRIASAFASTLQLRVIHREHCGNWVTNTNIGLSAAVAPFAAMLHQDDYWLSNRVRTIQSVIARTPGVDLILTACRFVDADGQSLGAWTCPLRPGIQLQAQLLSQLIVQNFIALPAPVFRLSTARAIGFLDATLWYTAIGTFG